jgi:hypothetical protein
MLETGVPLHVPAPAPDGPIACSLHLNEVAGRLEDFRHAVFLHLRKLERPEPTRLRLILAGDADAAAVRELLVREQRCCAFLAFTLTPGDEELVAELEVRAEAAPALDGMVRLAELSTPEAAW